MFNIHPADWDRMSMQDIVQLESYLQEMMTKG